MVIRRGESRPPTGLPRPASSVKGYFVVRRFVVIREAIEHNTKRSSGVAITVSGKRSANRIDISPTLKSDGAHDGAIACIRVGCAVRLVIAQENFSEPTVRKSADGCAGDLELERLADAPIRKPLALLRHHARSSR